MLLLDQLTPRPAPLRMDEGGVIRVGGTRVRVDTVIGAHKRGCSPEEILRKYPSLTLPDIYAALTYYLWHQPEMELYLAEQERLEEEARRENERRFPSAGLRERLLARKGG